MDTGNIFGNVFGTLIVFLVILIVVFLVCREIVCWYWKINQNIALLTEIRDLLKVNGHLRVGVQASTNDASYAAPTTDGLTERERELMKEFGIKFVGGMYECKGYRFSNLEDAIKCARRAL